MPAMIRKLAASAVIILLSTAAAEASVRNFFSPAWNGNRLAACLSASEGCGKPAADAFCKSHGYGHGQRRTLPRVQLHSLQADQVPEREGRPRHSSTGGRLGLESGAALCREPEIRVSPHAKAH
jgi:hypothetical protein